jgi:Tfp pilus assembly protein PilZ
MKTKKQKGKSDKRRKKRLAFNVKVKVYRADKDTSGLLDAYMLETRDITQKGLFLKTEKTFPINTKVKLEAVLSPGKPAISAEGRVAWIAKKSQVGYYPGMGIEMTRIKRGEGKRLNQFLKEKFRNYHHAVELKKMYLQLKEMEARLFELEECHSQAENFRNVVDHAIKEIDHIAHVLDREVWEIKHL